MSQPTPQQKAEAQLSLTRAAIMVVAGVAVLAIDTEHKWRIGGTNGAPAAYFAYLFIAIGVPWLIYAIVSYRKVTRGAP